MGKLHGKTLAEMGIDWSWHDPQIGSDDMNFQNVSHVIIATPILSHFQVFKQLQNFSGSILIEKPAFIARNHLRYLSDPKISVGLIERFNPAVRIVTSACKTSKFLEFHRHVMVAKDNLFLDLAIHDIDLALNLLEVTSSDEVEIKKFDVSHVDYKLVLIIKGIECRFSWAIGSSSRGLVTDRLKVDFIRQRVVIDQKPVYFPEEQPLRPELTYFLNGGHINGFLSHEVLVNILEC